MKDIAFHAFAEEYPLMPDSELGRLEEAMRHRGFDKRFPIVLYNKKILDGRNRFKAANAAGVEPLTIHFDGDDDAARRFVQTANEERRHLAPEWLRVRREERIARVAQARVDGESIRVIAKTEKISIGQVQRDLETATVSGDTVEPQNNIVIGQDGKKRAAKADHRCGACKRKQPPGVSAPNCQACIDEKAGAKSGRQPGDEPKPTPKVSGKPVFDWKTYESTFGAFVRTVDAIANAYDDKKSAEYKKADRLLIELGEVMKAWKGRLAKVNP